MIDRLIAISSVGILCLVAALPLELRSGLTAPAIPPSPTAKMEENPATGSNAPAIRQLVATALDRPLFNATRRPPENERGGHPDGSLNDLRLTGILIMPDQHLAIFARTSGKPLVLAEGEVISDWRIDNIAAQSVFLSGPSGTTRLEPKADPNLVRVQSSAQPATATSPTAASSPPPPAPSAPVRPAAVVRSGR